jgi:hypothetical protein
LTLRAGAVALARGRNRVDADPPTAAEGQRGAWARPVSTRRGGVVMAAALFTAGAFFVWQSALMPFGRVGLPGPGFFPFVLGVLLCVAALAIAVHVLRAPALEPEVDLGHRDVLVVFAALVGVCLVFERLGAYAALGLFTVVVLVLVARLSPLRAALAAGCGMLAVWAVFKVVLKVQLPAGPF